MIVEFFIGIIIGVLFKSYIVRFVKEIAKVVMRLVDEKVLNHE